MQIHGTSLIAGTPAKTAGATFRAFDPALGVEIAPDFHEASSADVDAAMRAAADAFADYRARSAEARAGFLEAIAAEIESLGDALVGARHRGNRAAGRAHSGGARPDLRSAAALCRSGAGRLLGGRAHRYRTARAAASPATRSAPDAAAVGTGRGLRVEQLSARLFRGRRRHRVGPGRRLSGRRQGASRASRHRRNRRARHRPRGGALRPARRRVLADSRRRCHGRRRDGPA